MRNLIVGCGRVQNCGAGSHRLLKGGVHRAEDVTIDRDPVVQPDHLGDFSSPLPGTLQVQAGTFDNVHFEFVGMATSAPGMNAGKIKDAFRNAYKMLKPGGWVLIESGSDVFDKDRELLISLLQSVGFSRVSVENFKDTKLVPGKADPVPAGTTDARELTGNIMMGKKSTDKIDNIISNLELLNYQPTGPLNA